METVDTVKKAVLTHLVNESPLSIIQNRDILEKRFHFTHDGAYYFYSSSIPSEIKPVAKNMTRMELVFVISKFSIETSNDGVKSLVNEISMQTDFCLGQGFSAKATKAVVLSAIPGQLHNLKTCLDKHLNKKFS